MVFISWMWRDVHVHTRSQTSCTLPVVRCAPSPTRRSDMVVDVPTVDRVRPSVCVPARRAACILPVGRGRGKNIVRALTAPLRRPLTLIKRTSVQYYQNHKNHKPPHDFYAARAVSPAGLTMFTFDLLLFRAESRKPISAFLYALYSRGRVPAGWAGCVRLTFDSAARRHTVQSRPELGPARPVSSATQRESWSLQKQDACYHYRCRVGAHSLLHKRDDLAKRRQRALDRSQQRRLVICWLDLAAICAARHNALGAVAVERVAS